MLPYAYLDGKKNSVLVYVMTLDHSLLPSKPPHACNTRAVSEVILLENRRRCMERQGRRIGLNGDTVLYQHRVQVVVRDGEALVALADVVRDLVEVLTESLHTPSRGLLHKMDVWEVAERPLQNKESGAGTKLSYPLNPLCSFPTSCSVSMTTLNYPCHPRHHHPTTPPMLKSPRTLSSGSRQRVQRTKSTMHVVFTSGKVSMNVCRVVSPLACIGGFRMEDGKLGIHEVNSSWRRVGEVLRVRKHPVPNNQTWAPLSGG